MLSETQARLEGHFDALSRERLPYRFPVYAIEHGLEAADIDTIRRALCRELAQTRQLKGEHWLLWIVVAAEIGYTYDGDEYWMSFAAEIPEWRAYGSRDTVRDWFKHFATRFSGFTPSGRWAEHFSIIAWPITHSILPRYLQAQFALHLYELRHELAETSYVGVDQLGKLLSERYEGHSSRFENFLQQTALTARLVLAMRDEDVQDNVAPIYRPTLARIISDLESENISRRYLRDARRVMREARLQARRGLAAGRHGTSVETAERTPTGGTRLIARQSADGNWGVGIALPDTAALMKQHELPARFLDVHRIRFTDKSGGWMPGRALLSYSGSEHVLRKIPENLAEPIIQFEAAPPQAAAFLQNFKIGRRPPWLLRIHQDGVAREVLGNHVRIGQSYLIAASAPIAGDISETLATEPLTCRTEGIVLYRLESPKTANPLFLRALGRLELGYALRARVEPVGLVTRWDASRGNSVWLPDEEILLRLSADFDVSEFSVALDSLPPTHFTLNGQRELIVSLGSLPLGPHLVEIGAAPHRDFTRQSSLVPITPEVVMLDVRAPLPWRTAISAQAGIRAVVDPAQGSIDDIINGRAIVSLHGPADRMVTIQARLFNLSGHLADVQTLGRIALPAAPQVLVNCIRKLEREPLSEKLHSASRVDLAFGADELGVSSITFAHRIEPLRWKLEGSGRARFARLIDETGVAKSVQVNRFDIRMPDKRVPLEAEDCFRGAPVESPGALFVARYEGRHYGAVASVLPSAHLNAFQELELGITFATPEDAPRRIMHLLAMRRIWRRAQVMGPLAVVRRAQVISAIERKMMRLACGTAWAEQADRFARSAGTTIEELQRQVGGSPGFASRMRTTAWSWFPNNAKARSDFRHIAKTYGITNDAELCDLALRLAFHPDSISLKDSQKGSEVFERLGKVPMLARGAFLASLVTDSTTARASQALAEAV